MTEPYNDTGVHTNVQITIDLNELVWARGEHLKQEMSVNQAEYLADTLRRTLTWDTLYSMVDDSILEYLHIKETHYGEIQPEPGREAELTKRESEAKKRKQYFEKNFDLVKLESSAWTIEVPVRKTK